MTLEGQESLFSTPFGNDLGSGSSPDIFDPGQVAEIRELTGMLGTRAEQVVLEIWSGKRSLASSQVAEVAQAVSTLSERLALLIGIQRLRPVGLSTLYQGVIRELPVEIFTVFEYVDFLCRDCQIVDEGISFIDALRIVTRQKYPYGRYWVDGAMMIAKEVCIPRPFELPAWWPVPQLMRGVSVGSSIVLFDGFGMPWWPGMGESPFSFIQKNELPWIMVEMKAIWAWWRYVGKKDPLRKVPPDHVRYLDTRLEKAALWVAREGIGGYFPEYAAILCCLRSWRPTQVFLRAWWQDGWILLKRPALKSRYPAL